jgi:hypothetical protein
MLAIGEDMVDQFQGEGGSSRYSSAIASSERSLGGLDVLAHVLSHVPLLPVMPAGTRVFDILRLRAFISAAQQ